MIFLASAGYMTLKGVFGCAPRQWPRSVPLRHRRPDSDLPAIVASWGMRAVRWWLPCSWPAPSPCSCLSIAISAKPELIVGGLVIGAVIVAGWYISAHLGHVPEALPRSRPGSSRPTRAMPSRMRLCSSPAAASCSSFSDAVVDRSVARRYVRHRRRARAGAGSTVVALMPAAFAGEAHDDDMGNHVAGGIMMGFGGVTALGCTMSGLTGIRRSRSGRS